MITEAIGDGWVGRPDRSSPSSRRWATTRRFATAFRQAKRTAKASFAHWLQASTGQIVDPTRSSTARSSAFTSTSGNCSTRCTSSCCTTASRHDPKSRSAAADRFFAGKAAPAYALAKLIIKFINNVAATIDADPVARGKLRVVFLPDYNVSIAERLIPASDISEQISTAGYEASGTSNMKFMMNGALTVGTRDGATIEMAQEAGEENFFLFGLTAEEVAAAALVLHPHWHYDNEPETREALDLISSDHFSRYEPGIFAPIRETLLEHGDFYMHLADLTSYMKTQTAAGKLYADADAWFRKVVVNIANSGRFSSDRAIQEYAAEIWHAHPCAVPVAPPS